MGFFYGVIVMWLRQAACIGMATVFLKKWGSILSQVISVQECACSHASGKKIMIIQILNMHNFLYVFISSFEFKNQQIFSKKKNELEFILTLTNRLLKFFNAYSAVKFLKKTKYVLLISGTNLGMQYSINTGIYNEKLLILV